MKIVPHNGINYCQMRAGSDVVLFIYRQFLPCTMRRKYRTPTEGADLPSAVLICI